MRAGEITFRHLSGLTYEVTIVTYTYALSHADRCELEIQWGDGTSAKLPRANGYSGPNINGDYCDHLGEILVTDYIRKNIYIGQHTYAGYSTYKISLEDPNRNEGILNIPYSVNVPFFVETELVINPFLGFNSSPVLLNPPIDNACIYEPYIHNPGAYDVDGDSLSYRLIYCRGESGLNVPGYEYPTTNKIFKIDPYSGDLFWDSPVLQGEYNVAILIEEWRHGIKIGSVTRDMQINVIACDNKPPVIQPIQDTCIEAGTLLRLNVKATDPNNDVIILTASGGPFVVKDSAVFPQNISGRSTVSAQLTWKTNCRHVRKNPYQVYFKASDDGYPISLVDLETVNIVVIAPAPKNFQATPSGNNIYLSWGREICSNAVGYKIYRKEGCNSITHGPCETGVPDSSGYTLIAEVDSSITDYIDKDKGDGLVLGKTYSYVIIAYFSDGAESYVSDRVCVELKKDIPVITNVSVTKTDTDKGTIYIAWSKPDLVNTQIHGPFKYIIYRSVSNKNSFIPIDSLLLLNDTIYTDTLNTKTVSYDYKVELLNDSIGKRFLIGTTRKASSVFLTITPSDSKLQLSWKENIPWINNSYVVYKQNNKTFVFDSISFVHEPTYIDSGLVNGMTYCYYIKSIGGYPYKGIIDPILNLSEIICEIPYDNVSPCPPILSVVSDCGLKENRLHWKIQKKLCSSDISGYKVYYSSTEQDDMKLIAEIKNSSDTFYVHSNLPSIAGCYTVSAIDSTGNESKNNQRICVDIDSCSLFKLPNVFTPNSDGVNDKFVPASSDYVNKLEIQIFNRWGNLIYKTTDPQINWDGNDMNTKLECPDGVYYYVCQLYELRLRGVSVRRLVGYIQLIR